VQAAGFDEMRSAASRPAGALGSYDVVDRSRGWADRGCPLRAHRTPVAFLIADGRGCR
jgi:hypothetical protein